MPILNREVRPPTLNFWHFLWFRMVPYGPNIGVPGFPRFFAFLQHSNDRACLYALPPQAEAVNNTLRQIKCIQLQLKVIGQGTPMLALRDFTLQQTVCHAEAASSEVASVLLVGGKGRLGAEAATVLLVGGRGEIGC